MSNPTPWPAVNEILARKASLKLVHATVEVLEEANLRPLATYIFARELDVDDATARHQFEADVRAAAIKQADAATGFSSDEPGYGLITEVHITSRAVARI